MNQIKMLIFLYSLIHNIKIVNIFVHNISQLHGI